MDSTRVVYFVLIFGISAASPVPANIDRIHEPSQIPGFIDPLKIAKTPADAIPLDLIHYLRTPVALFGVAPPNAPANTVPVTYVSPADPSFINSPEYKGFLQDVYARLQDLYDAFLERREALLNVIYCRNCTGNHTAWQTFMNALSHIPTLGWVARPSSEIGKPGITFIVATNDNGVVTGVGGVYVNNQPIVEYTFNATHMKPVKPPRPVNPAKLFPVGTEFSEDTARKYFY